MITQLRTLETIKEDFIIALRNNCGDKVTKVVPTGVLNGFAYAMAKLAQNINSDAAFIESKLFPEYATGDTLDEIANREGVGERYGATKGSVIMIFIGTPTTVVPINSQVKNAAGVVYETLAEIEIPARGFEFVQAESINSGSENVVEHDTLNLEVVAFDPGITSFTNITRSVGAEDSESDYVYRNRITNARNILSTKTEMYYEATIIKFFPEICRVLFRTQNRYNKTYIINVLKNNAADFDAGELANIKETIKDYLPLSDSLNESIEIQNFSWYNLDVYVPIVMDGTRAIEDIMIDIQIAILEYLDYTKYTVGKTVQWDDILELCKRVSGIKEIRDSDFAPGQDIYIGADQLPRLYTLILNDAPTDTEYPVILGTYLGKKKTNIEERYITSVI